MDMALEFLIHRLNKLDGIEAKWEKSLVRVYNKGAPVIEVYASIDGELHKESELMQALSQVPNEVRKQLGWEVLMYRLSIKRGSLT